MSMSDFWDCSLWEFNAVVTGWNRAQSGGGQKGSNRGMTSEQYEEMLERKGYR